MVNNNCDWSKMLTIFYEIFSTFQNARRASRIAHHASCTLNDASLALQRDTELRRLALVGTLQQRQGALAGMRVDLRARFDATEGQFPVGAFFLLLLGLLLGIGDFA
jgi:hypothetical protein